MIELITTSDGSHTLFVPELNEHYHSVHGAVRESTIVFIQNGYESCTSREVNILEVGFGTGLNALLTLEGAIRDKRKVTYTTIEKFPLSSDLTGRLNYQSFAGENGAGLYDAIISAGWNESIRITDNFIINKIKDDFLTWPVSGYYNLIYFDAFGPDKQPEMWQENLFRKIGEATTEGGIFVTYSAKGSVKRMLRSSGFEVYLLPGPPGKRQVIRAVKIQ
jgi:tRNA U34 5-methylaminomethyl-2-thiouridine-forming methyltransferase MnmC